MMVINHETRAELLSWKVASTSCVLYDPCIDQHHQDNGNMTWMFSCLILQTFNMLRNSMPTQNSRESLLKRTSRALALLPVLSIVFKPVLSLSRWLPFDFLPLFVSKCLVWSFECLCSCCSHSQTSNRGDLVQKGVHFRRKKDWSHLSIYWFKTSCHHYLV